MKPLNRREFLYLSAPALLAPSLMRSRQGVVSVDVQMVEIYASVFDDRGARVQNLRKEDFEVFEDNVRQQIEVFEPQVAELTISLLVDTTGSMVRQLPQIKIAISDLLGVLGADDSVGLFSFSNRLRTLQPFTRNRSAVMNALMATRPEGGTALYDAISQLARDLSKIPGKKVILLFTDGLDNHSVLNLENASANIRRVGVPIYTIAQGDLLHDADGLQRLKQIAVESNGLAFQAPNPRALEEIFGEIAGDLQHLYLLAYYSSNLDTRNLWRKISVSLPDHPGLNVRTKEGYWR